MIFNMTGGGNPLNFKVVGGTTEPSNPKENTIWVNTDKEITGWHFTSKQPDDMKEGEVWFSTGTSSPVEFNALKKNSLQVYPISAKQYVSGAWVDKTAKSYQNGEWVEWWNGQLYTQGNEWTSVTGGWAARAWSSNGYHSGVMPTLTKNTKSMTILLSDSGAKSGVVEVLKDIDLTEFHIVRAKFKSVIVSGSVGSSTPFELQLNAVKRNATYFCDNKAAGVKEQFTYELTKNDVVYEFDVTALEGLYDIVIGLELNSMYPQTFTVVLDSIVLE